MTHLTDQLSQQETNGEGLREEMFIQLLYRLKPFVSVCKNPVTRTTVGRLGGVFKAHCKREKKNTVSFSAGTMVAMQNDFVMTIEEDENVKIFEDEEDIEEAPVKKKRKTDKASEKQLLGQDPEFDPQFSFAVDGGASTGPEHAWDFTAAKRMLRERQVWIDY